MRPEDSLQEPCVYKATQWGIAAEDGKKIKSCLPSKVFYFHVKVHRFPFSTFPSSYSAWTSGKQTRGRMQRLATRVRVPQRFNYNVHSPYSVTVKVKYRSAMFIYLSGLWFCVAVLHIFGVFLPISFSAFSVLIFLLYIFYLPLMLVD